MLLVVVRTAWLCGQRSLDVALRTDYSWLAYVMDVALEERCR